MEDVLKVDRRLYIDQTGKKLVEGPPKAAELFRPKGGDVSKADLDKWGKELAQYVPEAKAEYEKKKSKPSDKSKTPSRNKAATSEKKE